MNKLARYNEFFIPNLLNLKHLAETHIHTTMAPPTCQGSQVIDSKGVRRNGGKSEQKAKIYYLSYIYEYYYIYILSIPPLPQKYRPTPKTSIGIPNR